MYLRHYERYTLFYTVHYKNSLLYNKRYLSLYKRPATLTEEVVCAVGVLGVGHGVVEPGGLHVGVPAIGLHGAVEDKDRG